ncbi:MAG TPA: MFS transporter [Mycobacteriales bacterium]|nr:MFS transporter [Mycobacteriales bacterium]
MTEPGGRVLDAKQVPSALLGLVTAALVVVIFNVGLAPALPGLARDLHATQVQLQWAVDVYPLVLAALVLPAGALGDRYGRRRALLVGLTVLLASAVLAALADGPGLLIFARATAGAGAAYLFPATLGTITATFPAEQRALGIGIWSASTGAGALIGLLASGALVQWFWPGSVFVSSAVFIAVVLVLCWRFAPDSKDEDRRAFDRPGMVFAVIAFAGVVLAFNEGPVRGWTDGLTLGGIVAGVLAVPAFIVRELRARVPMLDVRIFGLRGVGTGAAAVFLIFFGTFGIFLLAIQYVTYVRGYGPLLSAVALLPIMAGVPGGIFAVQLSLRLGRAPIMIAGVLATAIGGLLCTFVTPHTGYWLIAVAVGFVGIGSAVGTPVATDSVVEALPASQQGVASALNDLLRELCAAVSFALLGSLFNAAYRAHIAHDLRGLASSDQISLLQQSPAVSQIAQKVAGPQGAPLKAATDAGLTTGLHHAMWVVTVVCLLGTVYVAAATPRRQYVGDAVTVGVLNALRPFRGCAPRDLQRIADLMTPVTAQPGAVLCREGRVGRHFFVIVEGRVSVTIGGREVARLGPGQIVGEMALLVRRPRTATVTASEPLRYLVGSRRAFRQLMTDAPTVAERILRVVGRRIKALAAADAEEPTSQT